MIQQILALIVISSFVIRLILQWRKDEISKNEFKLWSFFWGISTVAIIFIKKIDDFVAQIGFSSKGIDILFYLAVILLFYIVFRIRINQEKMERNITKIIREISLKETSKK